MMPILDWEILYGDGSVATSLTTTWDASPVEDVQAIVLWHDPPFKTVIYGIDVYTLPGATASKNGAYMLDAEFEALRIALHQRID